MAIFSSDEGEGGTTAERVALIGIICFSFSWVPVFIVWKLFSIYRRRNRSREQEMEAGNMPFQTNPSKPDKRSWRPPPPTQQNVKMADLPQEPSPAGQKRDGIQRGKRRPMPTHTTGPRTRMLPDNDDDDVVRENHGKSRGLRHGRSGSSLVDEPARPLRRSRSRPSLPVQPRVK
ncbi:hypothetical protein diail_11842 [Diaporthe ilicicola]|nr:hypothetical protein diail_11842 [Diaporthe ilicicola]